MNENRLLIRKMAQIALFIAIIFLMAFTPIGYIKQPGLEITLLMIPVAVGAILLGPVAGAIFGLSFGITSFIQCFTGSPLGTPLLEINPFFCAIVCIVPRTLVGLLTGLIYKGMNKVWNPQITFTKNGKEKKINLFFIKHAIANTSASLLNTILFMTALCAFYYNTDLIQSYVEQLGASNVFIFVILFVGINGLIEAVINLSIGSVVTSTLEPALKKAKLI